MSKKYYTIWKAIVVILLIIGLGLFIINQFLSYYYKAQFLAGPCQLCVKLNPEVGNCWEMKTKLEQELVDNYYNQNITIVNLSKYKINQIP